MVQQVCTLGIVAAGLAAQLSTPSPSPQPPQPASSSSVALQSFVVEEAHTVVRFEADGTGRKEISLRVRALSDAGVQQWSQLPFPYTPATQALKVSLFEVRKADGTIVRGDASAIQDAAVQPLAGIQMFQDLRQKHLTVPAFKPGDVLAVRVEWTVHTALAPGHFFAEHNFMDDFVVLDERLQIDVPAARPVTIILSDGAPREASGLKGTVENGRRIYRWTTSRVTVPATADATPSADGDQPNAPAVRLSTFTTWEDLGRWYAGLAASAVKVDDRIRAKVEAIVKGLTTDEEKIRAIYDYVSAEIRYVSLSFGTGRYAPHPAPEVLANQYGDCKDKHTLLAAMLSVAGIPAWPALANSQRAVLADLPSPTEFNHLITVVPRGADRNDWIWLDTTSGVAPFAMLSADIRNKQVLVVPVPFNEQKTTAEAARLVLTPAEPPFPTGMTLDVDGRINALGAFEARVRQEMRGDAELLMRALLRAVPEDKWNALAEGIAEALDLDGTVSNARFSNLATPQNPLTIEFTVRRTGQFTWTKTGATLAVPLPAQTFEAAAEDDWKGRTRLELGARGSLTMRVSLEFPPGYKPSAPIAVTLSRESFQYRSTYQVADNRLRLERTLRNLVTELAAASAAEYLAFVRAVRADEAQRIEIAFETSGTPEIPAEATAAELYSAGDAAYKSKNYEAAEAFWKRTVELEPKHGNGWNALGLAYEQTDRPDEAVAAFRKQIEVSPYHAQAYKDLARVLEDLDDLDGAQKALGKHLEIHPLDGRAAGDLGSLLVRVNRYAEALPHLEKAVTLVKNDAWLFARLGVAYLERKSFDQALAALEQAVTISSTPAIWTYTAWTRADHGRDLVRAAELANKTLARAAEIMRQARAEAIDAGQRDITERVWWSWDTLGWIHFQNGELPAAERYLKAAWLLAPDSTMIYHLAHVYEKQGRTTDAATAFLTSVVITSNPRADAKKRLEKYFGAGADMDSAGRGARGAMFQERAVRVPMDDLGEVEARFVLVLNPDGTVSDAAFASGDERFRPHAQAVLKSRYPIRFPDATVPRLGVGARVRCGAPGGGCFGFLELPRALSGGS